MFTLKMIIKNMTRLFITVICAWVMFHFTKLTLDTPSQINFIYTFGSYFLSGVILIPMFLLSLRDNDDAEIDQEVDNAISKLGM